MGSLTDQLDREKEEKRKGGNLMRQKIPSGKDDGKWEIHCALRNYRKSRDAKKKQARAARKRNRK